MIANAVSLELSFRMAVAKKNYFESMKVEDIKNSHTE